MKILILVIPIVFFVLIGGIAFYFINKTKVDGVEREVNPKTVQDFFPIEDIVDGCVILKNKKKRKVIQCTSINYYLKTEEEQGYIEMIFQQFLNSLSFPISMFIQNRIIDNSKRMKVLREEIKEAKLSFPELEDYGEKYINAMEDINDIIGNSFQKNKYIIVPYDDEVEADSATEEEKDDYITKEIENRCSIIRNGLSRMDIKTKILNTEELIELFYSVFNRDDYIFSENISEDEALCNFVEGEKDLFKKKNYKENILASISSTLNIYRVNSDVLSSEDRENEQEIKDIYMRYKKKEEA